MKYALAAAFALASLAAAAAPASPEPPPDMARVRHEPDLRRTLEQYDGERRGAAQPRQLTPVERAELRRQLSEQGRSQPERRR